jgi:methyltransferase
MIIISQRIVELFIARHNENWMKKKGAIEFGSNHYRYIVLMHILFFISFFFEKIFLNRALSPLWPLILFLFIIVQLVRVWAIASLGRYWNTKIIVLANAKVIKRGPYRYIKHPNYFVVSIEFIVIPILFSAYFTAIIFTIVNIIILSIRIPEEERALQKLTEYDSVFQHCSRFLPILLNKCDK